MKMKNLSFLLVLQLVFHYSSSKETSIFDITDYGALGNGKEINTSNIQSAIDDCAKNGGGTVYVPAGIYLTGTLQLWDNTNLYLEAGAEIKGSPNLSDYPATDYMSEKRNTFLIYAFEAKNVSITGRGVINGNDSAFFNWEKIHPGCCLDPKYVRQGKDYTNRFPDGPSAVKDGGENRPGILVALIKCENVLMKGLEIKNAPNWCVHLAGCNKATISNVTVNNSLLVPNADAFDISVSKNVIISDCNITAGDDGIAISPCGDGFASTDAENIHVSNCNITSRSAGIRLGWSVNNIRNCTFRNLTIQSNRGICINTRHDEVIENILFSDIIIETRLHSGWWGSAEPIHISEIPLGELHGITSGEKASGIIRNVRFNNILISAEAGMIFYGYSPNSIQNIQLNNINYLFKDSKLNDEYGGNIELRPVFTDSLAIFESDIPAVFMKNVQNILIDGFSLEKEGKLENFHSNAIYAEGFENITVKSFTGPALSSDENIPAIYLKNGKEVSLENCETIPKGKLYETANVAGSLQLLNIK